MMSANYFAHSKCATSLFPGVVLIPSTSSASFTMIIWLNTNRVVSTIAPKVTREFP
jgi:hypothetical protein